MRLHIAQSREHAHLLAEVFPEDTIKVFRDRLRGLRVDAIIIWPQPQRTQAQWDRFDEWIEHEVMTCGNPGRKLLRV